MKYNYSFLVFLLTMLLGTSPILAGNKIVVVQSPDGTTKAEIQIGKTISYTISQDGVQVLAPSTISMTLTDGSIWGVGSKIKNIKTHKVDQIIDALFYKSNQVQDQYNDAVISFTDGWSLEVRAYNDGIAYRFNSRKKGIYQIKSEQAEFQFSSNVQMTAPYVYDSGDMEHQLFQAFENRYTRLPILEYDNNRLLFLPLCIDAPQGKRVTITESDLRNYPGMYLTTALGKQSLTGFFAPLRNEVEEHAGYNNLQVIIKSRHNYIAEVEGPRSFPWRAAIVSRNDVDLANTTMSFKLAEENVLNTTDWIKPGKVAWDWWNK